MTDGPFREVELHPDREHDHVPIVIDPKRKLVEWADSEAACGTVRVLLLSCAHRLRLYPVPTDPEPVLDSLWRCEECRKIDELPKVGDVWAHLGFVSCHHRTIVAIECNRVTFFSRSAVSAESGHIPFSWFKEGKLVLISRPDGPVVPDELAARRAGG